jgi:hypothetical protein
MNFLFLEGLGYKMANRVKGVVSDIFLKGENR